MTVPPSADPPSGPFVATVAGRRISAERLEERIAEVRRGPRGRHLPPGQGSAWGPEGQVMRRWIVRELVDEEVLAHEVRLAGLSGSVELVERVTAGVTVPESAVRAYYERNLDLYRHPEVRRIRRLLLADEAAAHDAVERLGAAATLEIRRGEYAGPLEDALFGAAVGEVVGPIRTEHGWHVARVDDTTAASVVPYAEARSAIEAELLTAARSRAFDAWLEGRRKALAVIEPEFAHPGDPVHGIPSHRH